jgi:hypothetical protein
MVDGGSDVRASRCGETLVSAYYRLPIEFGVDRNGGAQVGVLSACSTASGRIGR